MTGRVAYFIRSRSWIANPGSQQAFLNCPVFEAILEGSRGTGKTEALLMSFAMYVGRGFGRSWRGIIFRRSFTELSDLIEKSRRWFSEFFPQATYNQGKHEWRFKTGETLLLRYMGRPTDYWAYHGHEYPYMAFEELTAWPSDECFRRMFSCVRSSSKEVPRMVRATTNPSGVGHNWVKARYQLPLAPGHVVGPVIETDGEPQRVSVRGRLEENRILLGADPDYVDRIVAAASSESQRRAWRDGDWNIVDGGMFDDLWTPEFQIVPPVPPREIPKTWRLDRSFDWGQSRPFSVGWWAQSSGEPIEWGGRKIGEVRGDLIRIQEWYGWNGKPNEGLKMTPRNVARGIAEREKAWEVFGRVRGGPADGSIYNVDPRDPGASIAGDMAAEGVSWEKADKRAGSRKAGWAVIRQMLQEAIPGERGFREKPGLFISEVCRHWLRTMPSLPRDEKDPDDVDTDAEDHIADETRYRCRRPRVMEKPQTHLIY